MIILLNVAIDCGLFFLILRLVNVTHKPYFIVETKYIFVTGGVTSSLGKGIISASLARLLLARGYRVTIQKFDPYINIDPGTLNPYEHGECYVTVDGHEADLDLGHYERFTNTPTTRADGTGAVGRAAAVPAAAIRPPGASPRRQRPAGRQTPRWG